MNQTQVPPLILIRKHNFVNAIDPGAPKIQNSNVCQENLMQSLLFHQAM